MQERYKTMERSKIVSTADVASVAHHYVNPDASHFEASSETRSKIMEQQRITNSYLAEKNPHDWQE